MAPAGARHGNVAIQIGILLGTYVRQNRLGEAFAAETGFVLRRNPDTVRAPDFAFVSNDRLPPGDMPTGFLELAPDLAVEVVSPGDTASEVREKVLGWLFAGSRLVWAVDPGERTLTTYRSIEDVRTIRGSDILDGGDVLPGFSCTVEELFT